MTEVFTDLAVGEGIRQITRKKSATDSDRCSLRDLPNNTTSRSKQTLGSVGVLLDCTKQVEHGINEG